jgi:hypothetical protein
VDKELDQETKISIGAAPETGEADAADRLIGKVIEGKYEIVGFLGSGGFSRVYKAVHKELKRNLEDTRRGICIAIVDRSP